MPQPHQSDWLDTAAFLKQAGAGGVGLPKKVIDVDSDAQPSKVTQTCGMLYEAEVHADAVNAHPALKCPSCGQPASGIAGAKQLYLLDVQETGGKSHKGDVPPCPVPGFPGPPPHVYSVEPCSCRVSQEWAGAFSAELQSRLAGGKPRAVVDMTAKQREKKLAHLEGVLADLYAVSANPDKTAQKEAADYWAVIVADQIQRLCPGPHNMKPAPKPLEPKVESWANSNGFAKPPVDWGQGLLNAETIQKLHLMQKLQEANMISASSLLGMFGLGKKAEEAPPVQTGTPVYAQVDGTVSTTPAYQGQKPTGFVAAPPKKSNWAHVEGSWGAAGVDDMQKKGVHPNQSLGWGDEAADLEKLTKLPKGLSPQEFQKQLMNDWVPPDEPEITKTASGAWRVSWKGESQVFAKKDRAEEYAHELMKKGKWTAPDPKTVYLKELIKKGQEHAPPPLVPLPYGQAKKPPTELPPDQQKVNVVGGTAEEKATYLMNLKNVLKASGPDAFPKPLLKAIYGHSTNPDTKQVAISILQQTMGQPVGPLELFQTLELICKDLKAFIDGTTAEVKPGTMAYVKGFIDLVDIPSEQPKTVPGPSPAVPAAVAPEPAAPPIDKTARKKRTIRKIQD